MTPRRWRPRLVACVVVAALGFGLAPPPASSGPAGATTGVTCQEVEHQVQMTGAERTVRSTLCRPATTRRLPRAVVVLIHGSTYSRLYWDFPEEPRRYSASRRLAGDGYLTVSVDLPGSGTSDLPPSGEVTADANAGALHQVVQQMRTDPATQTRSGQLLLVGHSSGSALSLRAAAQYDDVDGVVVTGFMHSFGPGSNLFEPMLHLASDDPGRGGDPSLPQDYVTTQPGVRGLFYYPFNAAEDIVEADEQAKDVMPGGDPGGFVEELVNGGPYARQLGIPVLVLVGARDTSFCTPPDCPEAADEANFYPASPDLEIVTRPRTGHSLNLHLNARSTTDLVGDWLDDRSAE